MCCTDLLIMCAEQVHWTESRSTGTRLGAYTEHYNAEVEYFFKRQVLFGGGILCHYFPASWFANGHVF